MIVTGEAESRCNLLDALTRTIADVVLLDVSMPGMSFIETLQHLRDEHPSVKILVLSVHPEDQFAVRALRAGASGYVTKDHSGTELLDAVRRVFRGGRYVSDSSPSGSPPSSTHASRGCRTSGSPTASSRCSAVWEPA
jgi:DNA-binding NarL/FixJ family response regulator